MDKDTEKMNHGIGEIDGTEGIEENMNNSEENYDDTDEMGSVSEETMEGSEGMFADAEEAVELAFLQTTAGKVVVAVIAVCLVGAAIFFAIMHMNAKDQQPAAEEGIAPPTAETTEPVEEVPADKEVTDDLYPTLLEGNLTKSELEFILANGPEEIPAQGFSNTDYALLIADICCAVPEGGNPIQFFGPDEHYNYVYSLASVNRFFSIFTDYQFTEENDDDSQYGLNVEGDKIKFSPPTLGYEKKATITAAKYTDAEMKVYFDFEKMSYEDGTTNEKKLAILQRDANGLYRIVKIEAAADEANDAAASGAAASGTAANGAAANGAAGTQNMPMNNAEIKQIYQNVLTAVNNKATGYGFQNDLTYTGTYQYFMSDLDNDGIPELIVGAGMEMDVFISNDIRVFTCEQVNSKYQLKPIAGEFPILSLYIPADGVGLYDQDLSRGTGDMNTYRMTIQSGALVRNSTPEYKFNMSDAQNKQFMAANKSPEFTDISDPSGLETIQ